MDGPSDAWDPDDRVSLTHDQEIEALALQLLSSVYRGNP
jgi:hypothetical protein